MSAHQARVLALFDAVVDLPAGERDAALQRLCGDDAALLDGVRRMLDADADGDGVLGVAPQDVVGDPDRSDALLGHTFGAWRIRDVLGRGGMGVVYLAERHGGDFAQEAALKLIRTGLDDDAARQRFLRERQILARLRHRHIAALVDGGIAADGTPWFAMERIEGRRIDRWCDARRLDLRGRIALFLQVLDAVAHAHRHLVIHRDIKPVNVLVDEHGQAKLLDFGIARLIEDDEGAGQTVTRERAMTPEYASPEQLQGLPITTATDLYQLGLMLHALLTGAHPFGITAQSPLAAQIQALQRPPMRLSEAAARADAAAVQARATTSTALRRQLRGDLDAIVAHCIASDPERRYPTVDALADDLRRWQDNRPIKVRADSAGYRLRRFLRRNRRAVAAGATAAIALVIGSGLALWQARQATQARTQAEVVNAYLQDIFSSIDPEDAQGPDVRVLPMVDEGVRRLDAGRLRGQPVAEARLRGTLADAYTGLGQYDRAMAQLEKALPLAADAPELRWRLRLRQLELNVIGDAGAAARPQLETLRRTLAEGGADTDDNRLLLDEQEIRILEREGRTGEALALARDAFERARRHASPDPDRIRTLQSMYVLSLLDAGKVGDAIRLQEDLLAQSRRRRDLSPVALSTDVHNLANALDDQDPDRALQLVNEALAIRRRDLPATHPYLISSLSLLARLQNKAGDYQAAYATFGEAERLLRATPSPDTERLANVLNNWGWACYYADDLACANRKIADAAALWARIHPPQHPHLIAVRGNLAVLRTDIGQLADGQRLFEQVIATQRAAVREDDTPARRADLAATLGKFAMNLIAQGQLRRAQDIATEAVAIATSAGEEGLGDRLFAEVVLTRALAWDGDCVRAARIAVRVRDESERAKQPRRVIDARMTLGLCWGQDRASAERAIGELQQARDAIRDDAVKQARVAALQAVALQRSGQTARARREAEQALQVLERRAPWLQETRAARAVLKR